MAEIEFFLRDGVAAVLDAEHLCCKSASWAADFRNAEASRRQRNSIRAVLHLISSCRVCQGTKGYWSAWKEEGGKPKLDKEVGLMFVFHAGTNSM